MLSPYTKTECGFEEEIMVNYLGHVLLTLLVLDFLKENGQIGRQARIVNVSSHAHYATYPFSVDSMIKRFVKC